MTGVKPAKVTSSLQFCVGGRGRKGFGLHALADWHKVGDNLFQRIVHGAPIFAPTLFCDLAALAGIGLWVLSRQLPPPADAKPG